MVMEIIDKYMEDNVTKFGNIAHNMVPRVERILSLCSPQSLKLFPAYSVINLYCIEEQIKNGVVECDVRDMLINLTDAGMCGYLIATQSTNVNGLANHMTDLYARKNRDYGNSFDLSMDKFGLVVAAIRIGDKVNRLQSLVKKGEAEVKDESLADTFLDLACYSIMTLMWLDNRNKKEG